MGLTGEMCLVESLEKNPYKLLSFRNIFYMNVSSLNRYMFNYSIVTVMLNTG
jgi:hypothetical protein